MKPSNDLEKQDLSDRYWSVQLVCMKFQAHSSLETTIGIQLGLDSFDESRFIMTFFNHFGNYGNIMQFKISSRRKNS